MEYIFHEEQEGSLCAQHCLNALLQGAYFNPVDLGNIGRQMDEEERSRMAEGGVDSVEYNQFLTRPSSNVDDSGFFSVQVIEKALTTFDIRLVRFDSPSAAEARANPVTCPAFICNLMEHWLTIRKIGRQWFNLNSLLTGPHLLTDTYLSMYLEQLRVEGYSIFLVEGELPQCAAHDVLLRQPAVQHVAPALISASDDSKEAMTRAMSSRQAQSDDLEEALRLSQLQAEEEELEKALLASLPPAAGGGGAGVESGAGAGCGGGGGDDHGDDDDMLRHAIQASLATGPAAAATPAAATATSSGTGPVSPSEVRRRRLAFFEKSAQQQGGGDTSAGQAVGSSSTVTAVAAVAAVDAVVPSGDANPVALNLDNMSEDEQLRYAMSISQQP